MKTLNPPRAITLNADQRVYVILSGHGYSCLGFDVCFERHSKLAAELGLPQPESRGSLADYEDYQSAVEVARQLFAATGWKSKSELVPEFIGHEGRRVEVEQYGEKRQFYIGKSCGFIPCHIEIKTSRSHDGVGVSGPFQSIRFL